MAQNPQIDYLQNQSGMSQSVELCGHCEETPSTKECQQCGVGYCDECATLLHSKGKFRQHQIISLDFTKAAAPPPPPRHAAPEQPPSQYGALVDDTQMSEPLNQQYGPLTSLIQQPPTALPSYDTVPPMQTAPAPAGGLYGAVPTLKGYGVVPGEQVPGYGTVPDAQPPASQATSGYGALPDDVWKRQQSAQKAPPPARSAPAPAGGMYGGLPPPTIKRNAGAAPASAPIAAAGRGGGGAGQPSNGFGVGGGGGAPQQGASMYGDVPPARGWSTARTADGRVYYWNKATGETSWRRPEVLPPQRSPAAYQHLTEANSASSQMRRRHIEKSGWLLKKGKRRWLLLRGRMLFWFAKEQHNEAEVSAKNVSNFVNLGAASVHRLQPRSAQEMAVAKLSFEIVPKESVGGDKTFVFQAASEAEMESWFATLQEAIEMSGAAHQHGGHIKVGRSKRFCVVEDYQLKIFESERRQQVHGCVELAGCELNTSKAAKNTLVVQSASSSYDLHMPTPNDYAKWLHVLQAAIKEANDTSQLRRAVLQRKESKMLGLNAGGGSGPSGRGSPALNSRGSSLDVDPIHIDTVGGNVPLTQFDWYHGKISSDEAYQLLCDKPVKWFLVRASSRTGCFVVSWVQQAGIIVHTLVSKTDGGNGWLIEGDECVYPSITKMLEEYSASYVHGLSNNGMWR